MTSAEILGLQMCINQLTAQRNNALKEMQRCAGTRQGEWYRKEYIDLGEEIQRIRKVIIQERVIFQ